MGCSFQEYFGPGKRTAVDAMRQQQWVQTCRDCRLQTTLLADAVNLCWIDTVRSPTLRINPHSSYEQERYERCEQRNLILDA